MRSSVSFAVASSLIRLADLSCRLCSTGTSVTVPSTSVSAPPVPCSTGSAVFSGTSVTVPSTSGSTSTGCTLGSILGRFVFTSSVPKLSTNSLT